MWKTIFYIFLGTVESCRDWEAVPEEERSIASAARSSIFQHFDIRVFPTPRLIVRDLLPNQPFHERRTIEFRPIVRIEISEADRQQQLEELSERISQRARNAFSQMLRDRFASDFESSQQRLAESVAQIENGAAAACQQLAVAGLSMQEALEAAERLSADISTDALREAVSRLAAAPNLAPDDPEEAIARLIELRYSVNPAVAKLRLKEFLDRHPHVTPSVVYECLMDRRIKFRFGRLWPSKNFPKPPLGDRPLCPGKPSSPTSRPGRRDS